MPFSLSTGRVSMMISAECERSIGEKDILFAMCEVRVASTLALTPLPRPSERVAVITFEPGLLSSRNTSPPIF